ncbi:MAG: DUF2393 family protein [Janthinobacterium lividum]
MVPSRKEMALLPPETSSPLGVRTWSLAALAVLLVLGVAAVATLRHSPGNTGQIRGADPYAASLPITGVQMSEATNGTGGKATYVDGTVANIGSKTLAGATVQVTFATADGSPPRREVLPLSIVRTRVPYVDLQPISAEPILPNQKREFRLIFESVPQNWNVQPPSIQVVHADLK